jgi:hypothetical protein
MATSSALDPVFDAAGAEWNVDPNILRAVAGTESAGDARAQSSKGAQGLMQITPDTQKYLGVTDPHDPVQSIYGAAKYLSEAQEKEGTTAGALLYYHGGPGWRGAYGPESAGYVPAIAKQYQQIVARSAGAGNPVGNPAPPVSNHPATPGNPAPPGATADDDFLASTGAAPRGAAPGPGGQKPAPASNPDDDFLAATGAAPRGPAAPDTPASATPGSALPPPVRPDPTATSGDTLREDLQAMGRVPGAAISGAVAGAREGFGDSPLGLSPENRAGLERLGVLDKPGEWSPLRQLNAAIINPLAIAGDLALRGGSALIRGGQEAAVRTGEAVGAPQLGRDIAALPEAFPTGFHDMVAPGSVNPLAMVRPGVAAVSAADRAIAAARADEALVPRPTVAQPGGEVPPPAPPADMPTIPPGVQTRGNVLSPPANDPAPLPPGYDLGRVPEPVPASADAPASRVPPANPLTPPEAAPAARSAGAAANPDPIPDPMQAERVRNLESQIQQTAEDRAQPGTDAQGRPVLVDDTPYVEGIPERARHEQEYSPHNSLDHKSFYRNDTAYRADADSVARMRNEGMVDTLRNDAGDAISLEAAHEARSQFSPDRLGVFRDEQPVDASGLLAHVNDILDREGARPDVARVLTPVRDALMDREGDPQTMPSRIYVARKVITDMLQKSVRGTSDMADSVRASRHFLTSMLPDFDQVIGDGAPQFRTGYMDKWHEMSIPIDQQEFLQRYVNGPRRVTGQDGYLQLSRVNRMLDDVVAGMKKPGNDPAKSLTDEQIQRIVNVRNELQSQSLAKRYGAVDGSDTTQLQNRAGILGDGPLGAMVRGGGELAAHLAAAKLMPGVGNALLMVNKAMIRPGREAAKARREATALAARKAELLAPRNGPRNLLTPP